MRGGKQKPKKVMTGGQALLKALWAKYKGPAMLRDRFFPQLDAQNFINWRDRGRVPLRLVTLIATRLEIPQWGLNYEELSMMYPKEIPPWKEVVKSYDLTKEEESRILFYKPPVNYGKSL